MDGWTAPPAGARSTGRIPHLGDCDRTGALRLDALVGFLQDIAGDAGRARGGDERVAWLVRRIDLEVRARPRALTPLSITTWASGHGAAWAERRTRVTTESGALVAEAATIWAAVSPETFTPVRLHRDEVARWGEAAQRRVDAKLRLSAPPAGGLREPWPSRVTDFDAYGHVNNAVYWSAVEGLLDGTLGPGALGRATMEFRDGIAWGERADLVVSTDDAPRVWFLVGDRVAAAARFVPGI
ncbi:MAG: acyl-[acyl-carrier-protein] thioesterase [Actinomycetes bacterium]